MTHRTQCRDCRPVLVIVAMAALAVANRLPASDHLDTPAVIADPTADIGDLYAWTSYDGRRLNLVMTIVGHTFSEEMEYVFHVDSGQRFGQTTATTSIVCRIAAANAVDCKAGDVDAARGDASGVRGLEGQNKRFRVFAGMRDDPFFNNVKGTRDAYQAAAAAIRNGTAVDAAGCLSFDAASSRTILDKWRHTEGGPAKNFLSGWTPASLVASVDLNVVNRGGTMLAVWATTVKGQRQIDRVGRPLTGNAMLGPLAAGEVSDKLKEQYNAATPLISGEFIPEIEKTLGLYDAFDGKCGNQFLADQSAKSAARYHALAALLADDRLWVDSESTICAQFFSVELAALGGDSLAGISCGGRTPNDDAIDVYRSLLTTGAATGVDDGVDRDERQHSVSEFPFLASP
jgi:Domain of unknown function (DUF4331)